MNNEKKLIGKWLLLETWYRTSAENWMSFLSKVLKDSRFLYISVAHFFVILLLMVFDFYQKFLMTCADAGKSRFPPFEIVSSYNWALVMSDPAHTKRRKSRHAKACVTSLFALQWSGGAVKFTRSYWCSEELYVKKKSASVLYEEAQSIARADRGICSSIMKMAYCTKGMEWKVFGVWKDITLSNWCV